MEVDRALRTLIKAIGRLRRHYERYPQMIPYGHLSQRDLDILRSEVVATVGEPVSDELPLSELQDALTALSQRASAQNAESCSLTDTGTGSELAEAVLERGRAAEGPPNLVALFYDMAQTGKMLAVLAICCERELWDGET